MAWGDPITLRKQLERAGAEDDAAISSRHSRALEIALINTDLPTVELTLAPTLALTLILTLALALALALALTLTPNQVELLLNFKAPPADVRLDRL